MPRYREWDLACKVYVGNLGSSASKYEIENAFSKYGPLRNVWVARNPPGFAFVEFDDRRDAEDATRGLDGTRCCGTRIRVEMSSGRSRRDDRRRGGGSAGGGGGGGGGGRGGRYRAKSTSSTTTTTSSSYYNIFTNNCSYSNSNSNYYYYNHNKDTSTAITNVINSSASFSTKLCLLLGCGCEANFSGMTSPSSPTSPLPIEQLFPP
ncbi:RNA-binding protein 1-like isoform X1 [Episyrphus balteatus]|uniref:RNA-binding protein 1-like isoform X1 n=1 Tax=Episyrphus balteatus TaxID=286459 RepID=UPI0024858AE8|nr:RNA-binding protein 1-like isoform X1 [Episyrphus balteatus]